MVDIDATLIAQIINFLILVAILTKVAYKPLVGMLNERQQKIASGLETAEKERAAAEALKQDLERQLAAARSQAQTIIDKAEKFAAAKRDEELEVTRQECAKLLKNAQEEISRERDKAINEMRQEVVALSLAAASKIISENMTNEANAKLVANFIDKLDETKTGGLPC
ncbi:MAG: F0F1 ATP synthase subunit B [Sporomusaceae bacterium]|nr:F0F1 ATP synthase subunit B [Sporomusaceae bacterium]